MRKVGIVFLLSFLVSTGFSQDAGNEYSVNWLGFGKKGCFKVSNVGKPHTIKLDFAHLDSTEVYEVDIYFDNNKIDTLNSQTNSTVHTPLTRGKYGLCFYKIVNGKRVKVKPKILKGKRTREGIRVTSSSSGGTVTATVDA